MIRRIACSGLCFHLFVLRRGSYDHDLAISISDVDSKGDGRWMYVSMKCGDGGVVVLFSGRCI